MTPDLFSPLDMRDTTAPNRVMVSPMCQYSCEDRDGLPTDWHRVHLGSRAVGGAGIVMSEATAVEPRGRISPEDTGIWSDEHVEAWQPVTAFIAKEGSIPAIQLAHAGRKASKRRPWEGSTPVQPDSGGWETIGPSGNAWPYDGEAPPHRRMDHDDIETVIESFRTGAERALEAGSRLQRSTPLTGISSTSFFRRRRTTGPTNTVGASRTERDSFGRLSPQSGTSGPTRNPFSFGFPRLTGSTMASPGQSSSRSDWRGASMRRASI